MIRFLTATLLPAALLVCGALWGGAWALLALVSITVFTAAMDRLTGEIAAPVAGHALAVPLPVALGVVHFALWPLAIVSLGRGWPGGVVDQGLMFLAFGVYFGQISNSVAHELVHATRRGRARLGAAVYTSLLHGHHASAHRLVHHVHAATERDPNTARLGEGFWEYLPRAAFGEFFEGWRAENRRRARLARGIHPYTGYVAGAIAALAMALWLAGWAGFWWAVALAAYAQMQLFLSDYVQHYGLLRKTDAAGRVEPVGPRHAWNAPHWYSAAMMLNAPRHSDHHMRPGRDFAALELDAGAMPMLPSSIPVMATLALVPPLWRRVMDRRVARWQLCPPPARDGQGRSLAAQSPAE